MDDAQPVKEFLEPQLRAAKEKNATIEFTINFNPGLALESEDPEKISQRLSRMGTGACFVLAIAEASS